MTIEDNLDEESLRLLQLALENLSKRRPDGSNGSGSSEEVRETLHGVLPLLTHSGAGLIAEVGNLRLLEELKSELIRLGPKSEPRDSGRILRLLYRIERAYDPEDRHRASPGEAASVLPSAPELVVELAHDFRSPLTSILFLAEALRMGHSGDINELQHQQLGIIYSAALGLASMAGDIIELARGGTPLSEKNPSPFSAAQLLESVRDLVLPMAEARGLTLRTVSGPRDRYLGHPVPLTRVLLNLATNALQATDTGFVEIVVRDGESGRTEFSVRDTGKGLDDETQANLFEPFRTKGSASRLGFAGSGLGLTICRKFVAAMGGELRFETRSGWGTRFFFDLELPHADAT